MRIVWHEDFLGQWLSFRLNTQTKIRISYSQTNLLKHFLGTFISGLHTLLQFSFNILTFTGKTEICLWYIWCLFYRWCNIFSVFALQGKTCLVMTKKKKERRENPPRYFSSPAWYVLKWYSFWGVEFCWFNTSWYRNAFVVWVCDIFCALRTITLTCVTCIRRLNECYLVWRFHVILFVGTIRGSTGNKIIELCIAWFMIRSFLFFSWISLRHPSFLVSYYFWFYFMPSWNCLAINVVSNIFCASK